MVYVMSILGGLPPFDLVDIDGEVFEAELVLENLWQVLSPHLKIIIPGGSCFC